MFAIRWAIEVAILAAAAVALVRRAGVARVPFDAPLSIVAGALVGQSLLALTIDPAAGAAAWGVQGLRALLLLGAIAAWISIVRSSGEARWRLLALIAGGILLASGNAGLRVVGYLTLIAAVAVLEWPAKVQGWRRAVGLAVALPIAALTAVDPAGIGGVDSLEFGLKVEGGAMAQELARPFAQAIRVGLALFRIQLVVAFFRFLLLPVGLRTLPLARRFAVNFALTRSIPAFLSTVTVAAVVILGYGLHKAAEARKEMDGTLARASAAAAVLLDEAPFDAAMNRARLALGQDAPGSALILRDPGIAASAPESLVAHPAFADDATPQAAGLSIVEGGMYLVARHRENGAEPPRIAEVWVPVDAAYLGRISERALVDVELRAMPNVRLGAVVVSFGSGGAGSDGTVAVRSPETRPDVGSRGDLLVRKFPISRLFLPLGSWSARGAEARRGAVGMTLRGSLAQAGTALRRNPYLLTSNAVPFLLLGALGIVIGIVEGLSVRTGRSIVQAVVDDVRALESGANRIGSGDLDHRIPVTGKDELSKLAGALNDMAGNLRRQRDELVDKERLEADLEVARSIQQRLLPQGPPAVAGTDVAGVSIPSRVVGGDLFYFLPFEEGRLGLAVGDVAGKSVPAALLMSNVVAVLRAEAQIGVEVDESLSRINRLVAEQVEPNRFVTLFYAVVDRPADAVRYACAGHNPPFILRADGSVVWLRESGTPLGVLADAEYRVATERFSEGDLLVLYSDGVTEAESAPTGEFFGTSRLVEAVSREKDAPAAKILEAVLESLGGFTGRDPASDDRTLVVVRAT